MSMCQFYNPFSDLPEVPDNENLTPEQQDEHRVVALVTGCIGYVLALFLILLLTIVFGSCTTVKYVPVIEHKIDTVIQTKVVHDSIHIKDSTHVSEKHDGDTVWIEREMWHTKYIYKAVHDTSYVSKTDSVPVPYPVEVIKEVEQPLTWWQQTRLHIGGIIIFLFLIYLTYRAVRFYVRPRG